MIAFIFLGRNIVVTIEPFTQINKLASFRTEWPVGVSFRINGYLFADRALAFYSGAHSITYTVKKKIRLIDRNSPSDEGSIGRCSALLYFPFVFLEALQQLPE